MSLWKKKHCCETMHFYAEFECDEHPHRFDCPDAIINYSKRFDSYAINRYGDSSEFRIAFCPWCGATLRDLADRYFDLLEELGHGETALDDRPSEFQTSLWWRKRGL